ncbi:MAG: helix-turn-helix domain-containing protein [Halobacteriota archaeon]
MREDQHNRPKYPAPSNKMKERRFEMGYTQSQMADILGINQATYNRIENEVSRPSDEMLERIADILHLKKSELYEEVWYYKGGWRQRLFSGRSQEENQQEPKLDEHVKEEQIEGVNPRDIPTVLKELKELVDSGVITEAQFEEKRKGLLARL